MQTDGRNRQQLAELHFHLGQAVDPHILWSIAHEQGIRLPTKDYWEFHDLLTLRKEAEVTWEDYHKLFHWTELIQSSPVAIERSVYEVLNGAYRVNNITLLEISFNPMFRNRSGERDLDQIILAALRGLERGLAEFPMVRAGIIFLLDRRLSFDQNEIIVKKARKFRDRGVVGIDIAGPISNGFRYEDYAGLYVGRATKASRRRCTPARTARRKKWPMSFLSCRWTASTTAFAPIPLPSSCRPFARSSSRSACARPQT